MSKEQIEVITYEQDRLNYFTDLMQKSQKKYKRLFKRFKDAPYLSDESQRLSDAGREAHFYGDVVEMLEKGYRKQSVGEWVDTFGGDDIQRCSVCNHMFYYPKLYKYHFCPNCGTKMKGGAE